MTLNKYCQALSALRSQPAHELKEVGDQWRTPDLLFWGINALFGPLVLDLFADDDNAKCPAWYTAEDNALTQDWSERLAELGGASTGIELAIGRSVDIAINHDENAIAMHKTNHPDTLHYCESVFDVDPVAATGGNPVGLAWFSPDCRHFSKAKGAKPVKKETAAAPKVEFVDRYCSAKGSMSFRQVAKLLNAKETEFRLFLIERNILYRLGGTLTPMAQHISAGRFEVKTGTSSTSNHAFSQTRFTAKGVRWIGGLWAEHIAGGQAA